MSLFDLGLAINQTLIQFQSMDTKSKLQKLRDAALRFLAQDISIVSVNMDSSAFGMKCGELEVFRDGTIRTGSGDGTRMEGGES